MVVVVNVVRRRRKINAMYNIAIRNKHHAVTNQVGRYFPIGRTGRVMADDRGLFRPHTKRHRTQSTTLYRVELTESMPDLVTEHCFGVQLF